MGRKDAEAKVIQPAENMDTEHNERPPQSTANKAIDKKDSASKHERKKTLPQ